MKGMVSIESNGIRMCVTHLPKRKNPHLAVMIDNCLYNVATFANEETADWFIEILEEMFVGKEKE